MARLVSNYHTDVLEPPSQEFRTMQSKAGPSSSRATGWEDGVYFWILWERSWGKIDKIRMIKARAPQDGRAL